MLTMKQRKQLAAFNAVGSLNAGNFDQRRERRRAERREARQDWMTRNGCHAVAIAFILIALFFAAMAAAPKG
jgi:hypothetical protein